MIRCNRFLSSYELVKCQLKPCFLLKNENTYCWKVKVMPIKLPGVERRRVVGVLPLHSHLKSLILKILIWDILIKKNRKISFKKLSFEKILIWKISFKKFSFEKILIWKKSHLKKSQLKNSHLKNPICVWFTLARYQGSHI